MNDISWLNYVHIYLIVSCMMFAHCWIRPSKPSNVAAASTETTWLGVIDISSWYSDPNAIAKAENKITHVFTSLLI